ncbi:GPI transamidase component GAA1 [Exophiala dermatitidis]|uniref:Glycosylphosphatidylinositol transamidase n=1 Tax=Exophiala dermatitidis (strain ATCC 34100 / CBS 525.76 / NIH/UT8656) TaxID=858893 RepID=H6C1X6_EXODN|nr:glycosylphosphatidylinositol transamidase [Exophiala dermatitidis NIH/UT8656]EHY58663.1 glycosylphosphatidylinositol transamidase [Exophiala dermatitidis NIH/UT8656]
MYLTEIIGNFFSGLRRDDPRLLRIPPYLSALCILGGIVWLLLLPLDEYSRQTYISENALLPGQVHTYFGGSEQNVLRAYRHELASVIEPASINETTHSDVPDVSDKRTAKIQELFRNAGLKTATQRYSYTSSGQTYEGENVYAVLHAPRGDGTEAIVLLAPLKNIDNALNINGVPLLISLARYFKRWSLWSKDIIFLVTPDSFAGPQAWIDAYHSTHDPRNVQDLSLKSGALQAAVCIDYPFEHRFENLHIAYDGVNGALPNLDLFNTAVTIASGQMGIGTSIQYQHTYTNPDSHNQYRSRLQTLVRGMASQALGQATGPHSSFMTYHIDAITLTAIGQGWQDEMAFGRTVESLCRSLNNLLEKLHQSFFFYLLMQSNRFVSIGTYLPSAMITAAAYTIMAIYLWVMSGYRASRSKASTIAAAAGTGVKAPSEDADRIAGVVSKDQTRSATVVPAAAADGNPAGSEVDLTPINNRNLALPIALLAMVHLASVVPLYLLTSLSAQLLLPTFMALALFFVILPIILASALSRFTGSTTDYGAATTNNNQSNPTSGHPTSTAVVSSTTENDNENEQYILIKSLSMLLLGLFLTVLATLNFSLSMFLGVVCVPLAFVDRTPHNKRLAILQYVRLVVLSPMALAFVAAMVTATARRPVDWFGGWGLSLGLELGHAPESNESYAFASALVAATEVLQNWLQQLAFGWNVWGSWGVPVGVLCVWVPAWVVSATLVASSWVSVSTSRKKASVAS